MSVKALRTA